MPINKPATREIIVGVGLLVVFAVVMVLVLNVYKQEGEKRSAVISEEGEKDPNHVEVFVKLLSIDPTKGDISARLEFIPHGNYAKEEGGALARPLKLYVNSANGKQETDFPKDKRMSPLEVVINMYDGLVTDYPFDRHSAFLELYFTPAAPSSSAPAQGAPNSKPAASAAAPLANPSETTPATAPTAPTTGQEKTEASKKEEGGAAKEEEDVPIAVDFYGSIPGMKIAATKSKESDDDYVGIDMTVTRSSTVLFFAIFIAVLMWGATIGVLLLVLSIILRGRKIEVGMFSFLSALLFAMVAVRNSQPGVPPIGAYSDFISFFWAEVILALCLMTILFTWLLRPTAK